MSDFEKARDAVLRAEHFRNLSSAAETARALIRLQHEPVIRNGIFGFRKRKQDGHEFTAFPEIETNALYAALAHVRDDSERRARDIEASVYVKGPDSH